MICVGWKDVERILFTPVFVGFIVGRKERIKKKLKVFSQYVKEFDRRLTDIRAKDISLCPKCFGDNIIRRGAPKPWKGFLGTLECKKCGRFRREALPADLGIEACARIVNQVIRLFFKGLKNVEDIHNEVLDTAYDYGFNFNLGRTTIYDIRRKVAKLLEWFDRFVIVGLLEGIPM